MVLETIRMAPESPRTVPKGPGSAPEGSGMSRNDPGRSRMVLEGPERFWKVPEVSWQYLSLPHAPSLGGKPPRLPQVGQGVGAKYGRNPTPSRIAIHFGGGFHGGKVSLWKEESQGDSTSPYCAPRASWPPI